MTVSTNVKEQSFFKKEARVNFLDYSTKTARTMYALMADLGSDKQEGNKTLVKVTQMRTVLKSGENRIKK